MPVCNISTEARRTLVTCHLNGALCCRPFMLGYNQNQVSSQQKPAVQSFVARRRVDIEITLTTTRVISIAGLSLQQLGA